MPSLSLVLGPPALQRLHDALSCLAKFSEYVTIEATRINFSLAALNSSRSAHGAINLLGGKFFDSYRFILLHHTGSSGATPSGVESKFTCRLHTKALLYVFRQRYTDSKDKGTAIEKCELTLGDRPTQRECRILVRFICKHGVVKTYKLTYEDVDIIHAVFDKTTASNHWSINAKLLKEYMEHFGPKAEQLDISGEGERATLMSYTEKLLDGIEILKQPLHTAVSMNTLEFEEFTVDEGLHITINLKDFKAIVGHADSLNATISAYYSDPGRPLRLQYDRDGLSCEFTLMTAGTGGKNLQQLTRLVERTAPRPDVSRQPSRSVSQTPPVRIADPSQEDHLMRDLDVPPETKDRNMSEEVTPEVDESAQMTTSGIEAELSLFLSADEAMELGDYSEDNEDVLGWDVDMDHTRRSGPTVTQSGHTKMNHVAQQRDDDPDHREENESLIVGPTQEISQARGLFD